MFPKIFKIIFLSGKSYLLFIFVATLLSLFSYILSSNVILSVDGYLKSQIKPLLGGDIVLSGDIDVITDDFREKYSRDFIIASTIETTTTVFDAEKNPSLVQLVYRDKNYPVYDTFSYTSLSQSGSLVVSQELYDTFGNVVEILGKSYGIMGIIDKKPLGNISFFSNFSEIYLPLSEFDGTLTSDNSRLSYTTYLKFKGEYNSEIVEQIKTDPLVSEVRVRSLEDRNDTIGGITDRLYLFLNFFNLIVFILTFFIIILSLETFYKKLKKTIGLLSILGLKKSTIFLYSVVFLLGVFLLSFFLALVLNYAVIDILKSQYDFFAVYQASSLKGIAITLVLLFIGVYSPFYKVYKSDISNLISDSSSFSNFSLRDYGVYIFLIFIGFFLISYISSLGLLQSLVYSAGFILFIVLLYIVVNFLLKRCFSVLKKIITPQKYFYIYDAIRSTIKPGNVSFLIIFSSLISFASIFIFYVFSGSFISYIDTLTKSSNDTFVINIGKDDIETTREYFSEQEIYEIVSLRISEINGRTLANHLGTDDVSRSFSREFSSTTRDFSDLVIRGGTLSSGGVSVDEEFAGELGVDIGDTIVFTVAGLDTQLQIQNIRKAERGGANPFFYFVLYPQDFEKFPKNYFVSYNSENKPVDIQFEYSQAVGGGVSFINTREIIDIVLDVAGKILLIIYMCLGYIFVFSFLTFIVSVTFLRTFKSEKLKLLYMLGGQKKGLLFGVFMEYNYLVAAGLLLSLLIGSVLLFTLGVFIDFFQIQMYSYFLGVCILFGLFFLMSLYLRFSKKSL